MSEVSENEGLVLEESERTNEKDHANIEEKLRSINLNKNDKTDLNDFSKEIKANSEIFESAKKLALQKEFHQALIQDNSYCPFLVLCLTSNNESDVLRSLEIFNLLSIHPENHSRLQNVIYLFEGLKAASRNMKLTKEVRDFASNVNSLIKRSTIPLKSSSNMHGNRNYVPPPSKPMPKKPVGKSNKSVNKGKNVELYVPHCIFKEKRLKMTEALLTLNGIISITYDLKKCYCVIRAKSNSSAEIFGKAVANIGFECHLVTKVDNEEVLVPMSCERGSEDCSDEKENSGRVSPKYLSSDESDGDITCDAQALKIVGESNESNKKGWLSSATNFLQRSFYW